MKKRCFYLLEHIEEVITVFFLFVMCIFVIMQLLSRYFLNEPLLYTEEIARYSYIWVTFIGVSLATKTKEHITIDLFVQWLPSKAKRMVFILVDIGVFIILCYLFYWGVLFADFNKMMLSPALEVSLLVINVSFPLGMGLAAIRILQRLVKDIKEEKLGDAG